MLINADASFIPFANNSFHTIITSPPYWGLRKYAGEQGRIWGGDPECEHEWEIGKPANYRSSDSHPGALQSIATQNRNELTSNACSKCGAYYGALGLEPTPELYIQHIVEICRELKRILRDDGVLWLNMGDCYSPQSSHPAKPETRAKQSAKTNDFNQRSRYLCDERKRPALKNAKAGDLLLMPHRIALALQADGWIVRQDLVWSKPNPMPESVNGRRFRDGVLRKGSWRHTRAHEYVFMLVKQMRYYCNQEAVMEEANYDGRNDTMMKGSKKYKEKIMPNQSEQTMALRGHERWDWRDGKAVRNPRDVLHIPTSRYKGAHYATYPPKLIEPLIKASCPQSCCPECGQAWAPVVENPKIPDSLRNRSDGTKMNFKPTQVGGGQVIQDWRDEHPSQVLGYRPTCDCYQSYEQELISSFPSRSKNLRKRSQQDAMNSWPSRALGNRWVLTWIDKHWPHQPGIVFDPFIGSGTTGEVARSLGLRWAGIDISMEYLDKQAKIRTKTGSPKDSFKGLPMFDNFDNIK